MFIFKKLFKIFIKTDNNSKTNFLQKIYINVGIQWNTRLINNDPRTHGGKKFRETFLKDLDHDDAWEPSNDRLYVLNFSNVQTIHPSWINDVFSYFLKYATPQQIFEKIKFINICSSFEEIIKHEIDECYKNDKHLQKIRNKKSKEIRMKNIVRNSIEGLIGLLLISGVVVLITGYFISTNPHAPAGCEGYVFEEPRIFGNGGFRGTIDGPSNYGISMWRNRIQIIDIRPITFSEPFKILALDDLNVTFRFQTIIKIKKHSVQSIVENFGGPKYYERYIQEPLRAMIRKHVQTLKSRDIKSNREQIAKLVNTELVEYLKDTPFIVLSCVVGNIDYPKVVTDAVEKKLAAQQLLDEKETQKAITIKNAEIRIEEAKGIARAQEIINKTLTSNYLQHEAINAQLKMANSPNHTTVYIPSGTNGIPLTRLVD